MFAVILKALRFKAVYLLLGIYFVSSFVKTTYTGKGLAEPVMSFLFFFCAFGLLMCQITVKAKCNPIRINQPLQEAIMVVLYFIGWLLLYMLLWKSVFHNPYLSNIIGFWGMLVVVPFLFFLKRGYHFSDFGLTLNELGSNMKVAALAGLPLGGVLLLLTPGGKYLLSGALSAPEVLAVLLAGFGLALILAGFFEEFFFRAVLQTRLSAYFHAHATGIVGASLIFGLYHLPFHFFGNGPAAGHLGYALAGIFTETLITAPILGILWARTQNLLAPVLVHSLIDAISGAPRIAAMLHLH